MDNREFDNFAAAQVAFAGKIRTWARTEVHHFPGMEREDLENELLIVLWRCVKTYDPNRGASFNTYAQGNFRRQICSMQRAVMAKSRVPASVCASLDINAVSEAVDHARSEWSAEDMVVMGESISERIASLPEKRRRKVRSELGRPA